MKISIVTAVYNRAATLQDALDSVAAQDWDDVEHIIVDGMSDDGTAQIVAENADRIAVSIREPDSGIYDALNKGMAAASGDVVGFLHADDLLASPQALRRVAESFREKVDAVYGDLVYVGFDNPNRIVRYWNAGPYDRHKFRRGWMPPHPTVYVRREICQTHAPYRTDWGSAADYEYLVRLFYKHGVPMGYVPEVLVKMRVGGASNVSLGNRMKANRGDREAWLANDLSPPFGLRLTKPLSKVPQFFSRGPGRSAGNR